MNLECILYDKQEGVAVIRLNRPQVLNAMNKRLWLDMQAALDDARADDGVKVVVVTGEGRAFSTGADLKESKTRSIEDYRDYLVSLQEASRAIIRFEKPTIAAINGYAIGSGYELALACDIRIAAEEAKIGSPEAKVTSSVTGGAFRLVQDLIGPGKARELLFTGEYIDGVEAQRIGLVNRAVPADNAHGYRHGDGRQNCRQLLFFTEDDQEGIKHGAGRNQPGSPDGLRGGGLPGLRLDKRAADHP
jgi:enoyl-CoA hydratase